MFVHEVRSAVAVYIDAHLCLDLPVSYELIYELDESFDHWILTYRKWGVHMLLLRRVDGEGSVLSAGHRLYKRGLICPLHGRSRYQTTATQDTVYCTIKIKSS
jgi:hypothetical protein